MVYIFNRKTKTKKSLKDIFKEKVNFSNWKFLIKNAQF